MLRARIHAGKTVATYHELKSNKRAFQDLAFQCMSEKSPSQLEALLAAYRQGHPDAPDGPIWDLDLLWLKNDHEGVLKLLQGPHQEIFKLQRNKWKSESYLVRSLVKLKRSDEAIARAEQSIKGSLGNRVLLVLAHASAGDAQQTISVFSKYGTQRFLLEDCYRDEDLGPILRSDAFRAFRERFPEPKESNAFFGG
jgi:hypothetical protein